MTTHQELRDELAGLMNWQLIVMGNVRSWYKYDTTPNLPKWETLTREPIPASLDWLSVNGLPPGWTWKTEQLTANLWSSSAFPPDGQPYRVEADAPTELESRLRCCVAAWKEHLKK